MDPPTSCECHTNLSVAQASGRRTAASHQNSALRKAGKPPTANNYMIENVDPE